MKITISVPTALFEQAEKATRRLKLSRSELYRRALEAFLLSQRREAVIESWSEAYAEPETADEIAWRRRAARGAFEAGTK
jgi:metal-responsive CopG/Arc/MetJ family transcriptional regulator